MAYGINQGGSSSFGFNPGVSFTPSAGAPCHGNSAGAAGQAGPASFNPFAQAFHLSMAGMQGARSLGQGFNDMLSGAGFGFPSAGNPQFSQPFAPPLANSFNPGFNQGFNGGGQQAAAQQGGNRAPVVAVVDDFVTDNDGYNHGNEIAGIVQNEGAQALRLNIDNGGSRDVAIVNALDEVIARARSGQQIDAVNLSQQNFQASVTGGAIGQRLQVLQSMGIPVAVAAGNGGNMQQNQLTNGATFAVENSDFGSENRAGSSSAGNIRAEGRFTSQATPVVAAQAAALHAQGLGTAQIQSVLQGRARQQGGSLNA